VMASVEAGPSRVNPHPSTPPAKGRRRSWFSFATPASSTFSPTRYDKTSFAPDDAPGDEVELAAVGSTTPTSTPIAEDEREPEELLDIDGDPEKTVRKKKSRKLKKPTVGEALRMDDLAGKSSVRKTSRESAPKLEPDPGGRPSIVS